MLVITDQRFVYLKVTQEVAGMTSIFCSNQIGRAQDFQSSQGDVIKVSDWCRDDVEHDELSDPNPGFSSFNQAENRMPNEIREKENEMKKEICLLVIVPFALGG